MKTFILAVFASVSIATVSFVSSPVTQQKNNARQSVSSKPDVQELMRYFRIHRQGKNGVSVNWGMYSQAGISSYNVERSYDGEYFDPINQSSPVSSMKYAVLDEGVYPGYIFYRIGCLMDNGSVIYSDVEMLRIVQR